MLNTSLSGPKLKPLTIFCSFNLDYKSAIFNQVKQNPKMYNQNFQWANDTFKKSLTACGKLIFCLQFYIFFLFTEIYGSKFGNFMAVDFLFCAYEFTKSWLNSLIFTKIHWKFVNF